MAVYRRRTRDATLTAGQRTSLGTLLAAVFPGVTLGNVIEVAFSRIPGGVTAHLVERVEMTNLNQAATGDQLEVE